MYHTGHIASIGGAGWICIQGGVCLLGEDLHPREVYLHGGLPQEGVFMEGGVYILLECFLVSEMSSVPTFHAKTLSLCMK